MNRDYARGFIDMGAACGMTKDANKFERLLMLLEDAVHRYKVKPYGRIGSKEVQDLGSYHGFSKRRHGTGSTGRNHGEV
jgi:hypothetical protein